jgi:hypothetical protein
MSRHGKSIGGGGNRTGIEIARNSDVLKTGGAKSGAVRVSKPSTIDLVAGIMALPLSDEEKAQAIRRLLASEG